MTMAIGTKQMTTEELLAMPDDGVERWLIRGELREKREEVGGKPMTIRNRFHCRLTTRVGKFLDNWLDGQTVPRGAVLAGEAGVRLREDPDTTVGIDVAYFSAEVLGRQSDETTLMVGAPTLAVEIISPSDTVDE